MPKTQFTRLQTKEILADLEMFFLRTAKYISLYIYELPTHHCPFDILQANYNFVGYPLYAGLLGSAVAGLGVGFITPFKNIKSLAQVIPSLQRRLTLTSLILNSIFLIIVVYNVASSNLTLPLF